MRRLAASVKYYLVETSLLMPCEEGLRALKDKAFDFNGGAYLPYTSLQFEKTSAVLPDAVAVGELMSPTSSAS